MFAIFINNYTFIKELSLKTLLCIGGCLAAVGIEYTAIQLISLHTSFMTLVQLLGIIVVLGALLFAAKTQAQNTVFQHSS
jgi:hypothetical protein